MNKKQGNDINNSNIFKRAYINEFILLEISWLFNLFSISNYILYFLILFGIMISLAVLNCAKLNRIIQIFSYILLTFISSYIIISFIWYIFYQVTQYFKPKSLCIAIISLLYIGLIYWLLFVKNKKDICLN